MHKDTIFTFMNLIYILYIANNKVCLMVQLPHFKLESWVQSLKQHPSQYKKLAKSVVVSQH